MVRIMGIMADAHLPFEDTRSYDLTLDIFEDLRVDEIVINGDFADFYNVSSHEKNRDITVDFVYEIEYVKEKLKEMRKRFPDAKIVYLEGNHETRLLRYISKNAYELFGTQIIKVRELLGLDQEGIDFIPYGPYQKYTPTSTDLYIRHEPLQSGKFSAIGSLEKATTSIMFGHIHRPQFGQLVGLNGNILKGYSLPCLCDIKHPVMKYVQTHHQWSQGFAVIRTFPDFYNVELVEILSNKNKRTCLCGGYLYEL